jgi:TetR/AcrR family transcriptional regulator, fatty acid metabolism regulator protein
MTNPIDSEQRKAQILATAYDLFSSMPYEAVTMRLIAKKAVLSIGGLYWHFKSKEEILVALLVKNSEKNLLLLQDLIEMDASPAQRLSIFCSGMIENICNLSHLYLAGAKYHAMLSEEPAIISVIEKIGISYLSGLSMLIEQGVETGEFFSVNPQNAAITLISTCEGTILLWSMSPDKICLRDSMKTSAAILLKGLSSVQEQEEFSGSR